MTNPSPATGIQLPDQPGPVLSVRDLQVVFDTETGPVTVVDHLSFDLHAGKTLGMVGESGSGKSVSALALMGLIPPPGRVCGGTAMFDGQDLLHATPRELQSVRGARIAMIFQEPMTALNPVFSIGDQIAEMFHIHQSLSKHEAWGQAVAAIERVGIPDPKVRAEAYPHQLSGGMRQRAMIAMALACHPDVLIADEATTALDTTVQAQILDLILDLQAAEGMAILFISHNLAVVSEVADDVLVIYAGRTAETAPAESFFEDPLHPYSQGLLATLPSADLRGKPLPTIPGMVPGPHETITGCRFKPRCTVAEDRCAANVPPLQSVSGDRHVACIKAGNRSHAG